MSDLISRQVALDALGEAPEVWTDSPEEFAALSQWEMDVTAIKALPSAEPKTGKWIKIGECEYRCDQCGKKVFADDSNELNYCSHCGARMEGANDESVDVL